MSSNNLFKNNYLQIIYIDKQDLVLNYLQGLIYHKTPTNQLVSIHLNWLLSKFYTS